MYGSEMPRHPRSILEGHRAFITGQRVRITGGPLRDLQGIVESIADSDRILINAGESLPGICIRISPKLLETLDS